MRTVGLPCQFNAFACSSELMMISSTVISIGSRLATPFTRVIGSLPQALSRRTVTTLTPFLLSVSLFSEGWPAAMLAAEKRTRVRSRVAGRHEVLNWFTMSPLAKATL